MLTYSFANIGSDTLYEHLYKCIKNDILRGAIAAKEKLPSKRSFAKNLGISTITVENAYALLQSEGYIYSIPKKGFYVNHISNTLSDTTQKNLTEYEKQPATPAFLADFVSNQTNPDNFPFSIWAKLMRETISDEYTNLMKPSFCGGIHRLRQAICDHLHQFRSMKVNPDQVIIGAGTEYLYGLLIQLLGHELTYAIENPGYQKISNIYKSHGVKCCYANLDKDGIMISDLETCNANVVHLSPAHHYPTGIVTPIGRRYELLGWASKSENRYIIEDDFDSEFRMTGKPIPTMQTIDVLEKVIYMNTFSKSLTSTIRVSYMVLPKPLAKAFYEKLGFYSCTVSTFEQYTLARFIDGGYFEKHINRMRTYYRNLRDTLLDALKNSPLASRITVSEEDAGLHFLLKIHTNLTDKEIIAKAANAGIRLSCMSQYYHEESEQYPHTLIMNYSGIDSAAIPAIIEKLCECI